MKLTSLPWNCWCPAVSLDILVISSIDAYVSSIPLVACSLLASWLSNTVGGVMMEAVSERWES